MHSKR
jgi:hypothetical protein